MVFGMLRPLFAMALLSQGSAPGNRCRVRLRQAKPAADRLGQALMIKQVAVLERMTHGTDTGWMRQACTSPGGRDERTDAPKSRAPRCYQLAHGRRGVKLYFPGRTGFHCVSASVAPP